MGDSDSNSAPRKKRIALIGAGFAMLAFAVWMAWLWGLLPKGYRSSYAAGLQAYLAEPDAECAKSPTPECLLVFGEGVFRDRQNVARYNAPFWTLLGQSYAEIGDFEAADMFVDWYLSLPTDLEFEEWRQPYFVSEKVGYLVESGRWREAFALLDLVANEHDACTNLEWLAEGAVILDMSEVETEALARFAGRGCTSSKDEGGIERSLQLYRLALSASADSAENPKYHRALMNVFTGHDNHEWYLPISYCDALRRIDYRLIEPELWTVELISVYWDAGLKGKADEVIRHVIEEGVLKARPDSFASGIGHTVYRQELAWHVIQNHLSEENLSKLARDLARRAAYMGDKAMVDRLWEYLEEYDREYALEQLEDFGSDTARHFSLELRKLWDRRTRGIREDALDQAYEMSMQRLRRPINFLPYRYKPIYLNERSDHAWLARALFRYGHYEQGFEVLRELLYSPDAISSAVDGLLLQRNPKNSGWTDDCGLANGEGGS